MDKFLMYHASLSDTAQKMQFLISDFFCKFDQIAFRCGFGHIYLGGDYMISVAGMKFQPAQPRQISPYDYMWKLNFILARRDSFPPGIWLDLHAFSLDFSL